VHLLFIMSRPEEIHIKHHMSNDLLSQTAAAHPAAELRGMQGAAARLIEIE
jgi:hypothetical protein